MKNYILLLLSLVCASASIVAMQPPEREFELPPHDRFTMPTTMHVEPDMPGNEITIPYYETLEDAYYHFNGTRRRGHKRKRMGGHKITVTPNTTLDELEEKIRRDIRPGKLGLIGYPRDYEYYDLNTLKTRDPEAGELFAMSFLDNHPNRKIVFVPSK